MCPLGVYLFKKFQSCLKTRRHFSQIPTDTSENIILSQLCFVCSIQKLKRLIKSATLKGDPFYQMAFTFTFTNILRSK